MSVLLILLLCSYNNIIDGTQVFYNSNNMYSSIAGPGQSTEQLISFGKCQTLKDCQNIFESNSTIYRSFIYYPSTFDETEWRYYCYIRTDTWWNVTNQQNVISGQIDNFNQCYNDVDCELNGKCINSKCECRSAWTGTFCQYLNFKLAQKTDGYQRSNYSQWSGSPIYDNKTKKWNIFAGEMYNHCGINSCCAIGSSCNSQIVRALSDTAGGPYIFDSITKNYFSAISNIIYIPNDDIYILYHQGSGMKNTPVTNGCIDGYTNGPPPNNTDINIGPYPDVIDPYAMYISYSKSLDGPWNNMIPMPGYENINIDLCLSMPYLYDNGSILMMWVNRSDWNTGSVIQIITANSWNTTYTLHDNPLWTTELNDDSSMEDPFLWKDVDNTFHLLMHGMIYVDNPNGNPWKRSSQGRHAYSYDGLNWILSPHYTYNTTICYTDGDCINYARRERPSLIIHPQTKQLLYLTNGIQSNNLNKYDKSFMGAVPLHTNNDAIFND